MRYDPIIPPRISANKLINGKMEMAARVATQQLIVDIVVNKNNLRRRYTFIGIKKQSPIISPNIRPGRVQKPKLKLPDDKYVREKIDKPPEANPKRNKRRICLIRSIL